MFGKEPSELISRSSQITAILDTFTAEAAPQQVYMITGVRGCGKTVFVTEIANTLKQKDDWIVLELNPERNLLETLAAKLSSENSLAHIFENAKINLSFFGFGLTVSGSAPITDIETALTKMLESLKKHGKRILVTIDEVTNTQNMRIFASSFQIFVRQGLPLFLLMTGLYDNIRKLQDEKSLTFLYRAPRIELKPLNIGTISRSYQKTFSFNPDKALSMAKMTRGYSFAFQVLGYYTWENDSDPGKAFEPFRQTLDDYVYEKIWSELSAEDRRVSYGIAMTPSRRIKDIRDFLQMETNQFNPYRKRLINKGILSGDEHGYVQFILPFFEDYIIENYSEKP